jgi:hypothetical protein
MYTNATIFVIVTANGCVNIIGRTHASHLY